MIKPWIQSHCFIDFAGFHSHKDMRIFPGVRESRFFTNQGQNNHLLLSTLHISRQKCISHLYNTKSKLPVGRNPNVDNNFEPPQIKGQLADFLLYIWFGTNDLDWMHISSLESSALNDFRKYAVLAVIKRALFLWIFEKEKLETLTSEMRNWYLVCLLLIHRWKIFWGKYLHSYLLFMRIKEETSNLMKSLRRRIPS